MDEEANQSVDTKHWSRSAEYELRVLEKTFVKKGGKLRDIRMPLSNTLFKYHGKKNKPRRKRVCSHRRGTKGRKRSNSHNDYEDDESSHRELMMIANGEEEARRIQDNNISSFSHEAEWQEQLAEEPTTKEGQRNSEIIELRMMQNQLSIEKLALKTKRIKIARHENEQKKKKMLVIAEELKLSLKMSKINDQIKMKKNN